VAKGGQDEISYVPRAGTCRVFGSRYPVDAPLHGSAPSITSYNVAYIRLQCEVQAALHHTHSHTHGFNKCLDEEATAMLAASQRMRLRGNDTA